MNIIFFEDNRTAFLPLVYTKPIAKLRVGILTIEEKWSKSFKETVNTSFIVEDYLKTKFPIIVEDINVFINSRFFPNEKIVDFIVNNLNSNEAIYRNDVLIVAKCSKTEFDNKSFTIKDYNENFNGLELKTVTDIFSKNGAAIEADFKLLTKDRVSQKISGTNTLIGDNVFIEEGAKVEASILNSNEGPIYIGKDAEIMEGCIVRGPFALCDNGGLKMGAKVYGPTTVGKFSKVGGEVNNVVIQDYSNKGHDGFLGNSVIGEWCNLGADTNSSNLKNNYAEVRLWSYQTNIFEPTGLQFCGLIMGDHSKCGINTMFNTGTVVGVAANIFGSGFPRNFVASYSWGGASGFTTYRLEKCFEVAQKVMERRGIDLLDEDKEILSAIFEQTESYRK